MVITIKVKNIMRLIGILIFTCILLRINLKELIEKLIAINPILLILALSLTPIQILFKSERWRTLLRTQSVLTKWTECFGYYMSSLFIGALTPGRLGEFIKVRYLTNKGHALSKVLASTITERLFDIITLLIMSALSLVFIIKTFLNMTIITIALTLTLMITILIAYFKKAEIVDVISRLFPNWKLRELKMPSKKALTKATALTLIAWIVYYIQVYILNTSLNLGLSFIITSAFITISALITLLPISISGIGTRDLALIILFGLQGLSAESALSFSLNILFIYILNSAISFLFFMKNPLPLKFKQSGTFLSQLG